MGTDVNDVPWVCEHERPVWHRPKDGKEGTPEMACGQDIPGAPLVVRNNLPAWVIRCAACLATITDTDLCIRHGTGQPLSRSE